MRFFSSYTSPAIPHHARLLRGNRCGLTRSAAAYRQARRRIVARGIAPGRTGSFHAGGRRRDGAERAHPAVTPPTVTCATCAARRGPCAARCCVHMPRAVLRRPLSESRMALGARYGFARVDTMLREAGIVALPKKRQKRHSRGALRRAMQHSAARRKDACYSAGHLHRQGRRTGVRALIHAPPGICMAYRKVRPDLRVVQQ